VEEPIIDDPVLSQRYQFRRLKDDDGGDVLQLDCWIDPGGGVLLAHVHPAMEERFEVISGQVTFTAGRKKITKGPGEGVVVVPPGTRHGYRNSGKELAQMRCEARPPSSLQEFLQDAAGLGRAGLYTPRGIPKSWTGLLKLSVMVRHYTEAGMVILLWPPPLIQKLLLYPLARVGERRGYRAGMFGDEVPAGG
jgi:quercetin dioxygenase-like cupin family protein